MKIQIQASRPKTEGSKLLSRIILLFLLSIVIEVFIFNFRYFLPRIFHAPVRTIPASQFTQLTSAERSDGGIVLTEQSASFKIPDVGVPVYSVRLVTSGDYQYLNTDITYVDDNFSGSYLDAGVDTIRPDVFGSDVIHFISSGNCRSMGVDFREVRGASATISAVVLNSEYLNIRPLRLLFVFLILCLIYAVHHFRLWEKKLSLTGNWQSATLVVLLSTAICFAFVSFYLNNCSGPFVSQYIDRSSNDSYQYLTQAFASGQLYFTVSPPTELQSLANPYDYSQRTNITFLWDNVYYHGKYYSYFGIAPVILLLLPFRLLTGLYLSTSLACFLFTAVALAAALALYKRIISVWFRDINYLMFLAGAVCVCYSLILWLTARPSFYELAVAAAIAFLLLALDMLFGWLAGKRSAFASFLLAGLFFGLMVASRAIFIFFIATAIPFLYKFAMGHADATKPAQKRANKLRCLTAFFAPLGGIAIVLCAYNYMRFGSIFDFGNNYQLTVSDIRFNKVTNFVQAINGFYHYYLQPLSFDLNFPFFQVELKTPSSISQYSYNSAIAGIFNFPVLLIVPAVVYIMRRSGDRLRRQFVLLTLCLCLVVSYLDITMAGALMRYTLDIYPMLLVCALILWMELYTYFAGRGASKPITKLFTAVAALTVVITCLICTIGENNFFVQNFPALYQSYTGLFEFWR